MGNYSNVFPHLNKPFPQQLSYYIRLRLWPESLKLEMCTQHLPVDLYTQETDNLYTTLVQSVHDDY